MKESELFTPVVLLLESQGYTVKGEVGALDVFGMKDNMTLGVELKVKPSLKLIYQAVDRQRLCDVVYIALPKKVIYSSRSSYRSLAALLRLLEIGLIMVDDYQASVLIESVPYDRERSRVANKSKKQRLVKEFLSRENTTTIGGAQGQRLTAYREKCVKIASYMIDREFVSPKELKEQLHITEVSGILRNNYYGWFTHLAKGQYTLSDTYKQSLTKESSS